MTLTTLQTHIDALIEESKILLRLNPTVERIDRTLQKNLSEIGRSEAFDVVTSLQSIRNDMIQHLCKAVHDKGSY